MPLQIMEKRREMRIAPVFPGQEKVFSKSTSAVAIHLCQCSLSLGRRQEDGLVRGGEGAVRPR